MPKIDLNSFGLSTDDHTNKSRNKFFNLTPSSQGVGIDVVFQNSLHNSDYYYRKDPQDSISGEIMREKSRVVLRYKRAIKNNMGFTSPSLKDVVENVRTAAAQNYMAIVNDQIDNDKFEQNIQKYFNLTGMQQMDQNMGVLLDTMKKHGFLMPEEKQQIELLIKKGDIRILMDETILLKVIQDPELMQWLINFIRQLNNPAPLPLVQNPEKKDTQERIENAIGRPRLFFACTITV